jgi:aryl-alcohol dehydrogenase-like predicted oxidoreductase
MNIKNIGSQGLKASALGLGCMGMSEFYGKRNDEESIRTLHRALDMGVTFLDTADMYGPFHNEELLSKALIGKRKQVTLATKFGIVRDPANPMVRGINGKPEYVQSACEASLRRLKTDVIDLYYLHRVDPETPIEVTVGAMAGLVKQGKVRTIGLSEASVPTLRKAHSIHPITALQTEYSLWSRDPEEGILDACKELGIAFVAYSPLGRGFLSGQFKKTDDLEANDYRRNSPRFQPENIDKNSRLVTELEKIANRKSCTLPQLALAWVLAQGEFIFPIPGTKRIKYLEENVEAMNIVLTNEELIEMNQIAPKGIFSGLRYPESMMKSVNR